MQGRGIDSGTPEGIQRLREMGDQPEHIINALEYANNIESMWKDPAYREFIQAVNPDMARVMEQDYQGLRGQQANAGLGYSLGFGFGGIKKRLGK
jgi:hypothetical protein